MNAPLCPICDTDVPMRWVESERWGNYWRCLGCGAEMRSVRAARRAGGKR